MPECKAGRPRPSEACPLGHSAARARPSQFVADASTLMSLRLPRSTAPTKAVGFPAKCGAIAAFSRANSTVRGCSLAGAMTSMVSSVFAMKIAMAKAKTAGIAYVGVRNNCHYGAAGYYASMAIEKEMIGFSMANDIPTVNAPGAKGSILGSNPFAFAACIGEPDADISGERQGDLSGEVFRQRVQAGGALQALREFGAL